MHWKEGGTESLRWRGRVGGRDGGVFPRVPISLLVLPPSLPPSLPSPCFSFDLPLPATLILPSHSAAAQSLSLRETLLLSRRARRLQTKEGQGAQVRLYWTRYLEDGK